METSHDDTFSVGNPPMAPYHNLLINKIKTDFQTYHEEVARKLIEMRILVRADFDIVDPRYTAYIIAYHRDPLASHAAPLTTAKKIATDIDLAQENYRKKVTKSIETPEPRIFGTVEDGAGMIYFLKNLDATGEVEGWNHQDMWLEKWTRYLDSVKKWFEDLQRVEDDPREDCVSIRFGIYGD